MRLSASHRYAPTWPADLGCASDVLHSPKLPVNPSIFQENAGSPGWRPGGSYARSAGLRLVFSTAAKEGRSGANWSGSARRFSLSDKPKICCLVPPKEDAASRGSNSLETEREKPRARRDTTERRCCPFPAPPPQRVVGRKGSTDCFCADQVSRLWQGSVLAPPTGHCPSPRQQEVMQYSPNRYFQNLSFTFFFIFKNITRDMLQTIYYVDTNYKIIYKK